MRASACEAVRMVHPVMLRCLPVRRRCLPACLPCAQVKWAMKHRRRIIPILHKDLAGTQPFYEPPGSHVGKSGSALSEQDKAFLSNTCKPLQQFVEKGQSLLLLRTRAGGRHRSSPAQMPLERSLASACLCMPCRAMMAMPRWMDARREAHACDDRRSCGMLCVCGRRPAQRCRAAHPCACVLRASCRALHADLQAVFMIKVLSRLGRKAKDYDLQQVRPALPCPCPDLTCPHRISLGRAAVAWLHS